MLARRPTVLPDGMEGEEGDGENDEEYGPSEDHGHGEVVQRADGLLRPHLRR